MHIDSTTPEIKRYAHLLRLLMKDREFVAEHRLLKPQYMEADIPSTGHCYAGSEAMFHLLGGFNSDYRPKHVSHEGDSHWFLQNSRRDVLDLTADQFTTPVPYSEGRGVGFLTRQPSRRARVMMDWIASLQN